MGCVLTQKCSTVAISSRTPLQAFYDFACKISMMYLKDPVVAPTHWLVHSVAFRGAGPKNTTESKGRLVHQSKERLLDKKCAHESRIPLSLHRREFKLRETKGKQSDFEKF